MIKAGKGLREQLKDSWTHTYSQSLSLRDLQEYFKDIFLAKLEHVVRDYIQTVWTIPDNSPIKLRADYLIMIELPNAMLKSDMKNYLNKDFIFTADYEDCKDIHKKSFKVIGIEAFAINDDIPQTKYGLLIKEINNDKD